MRSVFCRFETVWQPRCPKCGPRSSTTLSESSTRTARFEQLAGTVQMSINARETFLKRQRPQDREELMWAAVSRADHAFLTARKSTAVARKYTDALASASEG